MSGDDQRRRQLWQLADELRGSTEGRSRLSLLREAALRGLMPTWRDQAELAAAAGVEDSVDPSIVADFLLALTDREAPKRVLDPWAGLGVTLAALESEGRVRSGVAIEINQDIYELVMALRGGSRIQWLLGDASEILADGLDPFDLIVGFPPINLRPAVLETQRPHIRLRSSKTYTMLVQAALVLGPAGVLVAVLPESFFGSPNLAVREALKAASVFPVASFALPRRVFSTSIAMSLVVFGREADKSLFVAELDPSTDMVAVVSNFRARNEGVLPQLGRLVTRASFISWRGVIGDSEIRDAARAAGLEAVPFSTLCSEFHAPRRAGDPFAPKPNSVYLPKLGTSPAVTTIDQLEIKPQNYLQLVVRPDLADPAYVAGFLNSQLGRKIRDRYATGTYIPQISLMSLRDGFAYLPPSLHQQRATVVIARTLTELRHSMQSLDRELWERPLAARRVEMELHELLEGDGSERWMESLPFPLASLLWLYQATDDPERRCRNLVRFFEGATLFLVDLHLSALRGDPGLLGSAIGHGRRDAEIYSRGSIGIWADLLARLAKRTRELLATDSSRILELFRVSDPLRLASVASRPVVTALLQDGAGYRRDWIGHAAVAGVPEWERRLSQAEATLARFRDGLGEAFVGWDLIRPGQGRNHGGVITTAIEQLVGSRSHFREGTVELRQLPEDGGLYMREAGASLLLQLGPLFRMRRSPETAQDACYFYDRLQPEGVRWVSHHYEPQPEEVRPDSEVVQLIAELNAFG